MSNKKSSMDGGLVLDKRDTQFQGFAKLLYDELYDQFYNLRCQEEDMDYMGRNKEAEQTRKEIKITIARRAYDLAYHAAFYIDERDCDVFGFEGAMQRIPDMTELPKEQE